MARSYREIADILIEWSASHPRSLPWKQTDDPYRIWISEIILQQTRVAQGIPYYLRFIRRFPTIRRLARASEDDVLAMWQGLGYNSRARYLHQAARHIMEHHGGRFPRQYEDIRALKGVGDYTAAAIASFAFGAPTPVLDSNVIRVLCRVFGIADSPAYREVRERMYEHLRAMIQNQDPAAFNQAIMNFGAMQCTPDSPECDACPLSACCTAWREGNVDALPVRKNKPVRRERYLHYFVMCNDSRIVIRKRDARDIWRHLYDLPCLETPNKRLPSLASRTALYRAHGYTGEVRHSREARLSQTLTHQILRCSFYLVQGRRKGRKKLPEGARFELFENLGNFAFPKVTRTYLKDNSLYI